MFRDRWETFDIVSAGDRAWRAGLRAGPPAADPVAQPRLFRAGPGRLSMCCCRASCSARPMPTCGWCRSRAAIFILAIRFKSETRFPLAHLAGAGRGRLHAGPDGRDDRQHGDRRTATRRSSSRRSTMSRWDRGVAVLVWDKCEQWALRRSDHLGASPSSAARPSPTTNGRWPDRP